MKEQQHPNYLRRSKGRLYSCSVCHSQLTTHEDVISRAFQGRYGPAFLVARVINIQVGKHEDRTLMTGLHTVADIFCTVCHARLGWKYLRAVEKDQKYKEGRFIVEKTKVVRDTV